MLRSEWIMGGSDISVPLALRRRVFVEEQGFPAAIEQDAKDEYAMHVVMYDDAQDALPVATGRIYNAEDGFHLGRICVIPEYRGQHVADLMVRLMIWKAMQFTDRLTLSAQAAVSGYYERYGFVRQGEEYPEHGVPHVRMCVTKDSVRFPSACGHDNAKTLFED